ncbi:MAG: Nif3-like dinuclear metal center hexameric protein [Thermoguttaceae bacterium]|nr:Nif3-like dinuclear metal center hexameric protein [Thermoguttaceae bacterium]
MKLQTLVEFLEKIFPLELAESWDNVGLLIGDRRREIKRVLTCLTIDRAVVDEAVATAVDCVVSHHPFPFRAAKRWTFDTTDGEILSKLMGARIAVYSPHTAHDSAFFGINRQLAAGLGLLDVRPLIPGTVAATRDALDGLESIVADFVAQDFPTKAAKSDAAAPLLGAGRIGRCEKPTTFAALIEQVKDMLQIPALLAVGDDKQPIRKIAIGCGAADDFIGNAVDAGADALLLGEARFHACLEARARGIGLILAGHYATERFAACILADRIARKFPELAVKASDQESDPIRVV